VIVNLPGQILCSAGDELDDTTKVRWLDTSRPGHKRSSLLGEFRAILGFDEIPCDAVELVIVRQAVLVFVVMGDRCSDL
jgi:hypothetical protein